MNQDRRSMITGLGAGAAALASTGQAQAQQAARGMPTNQRPLKEIDITNIVTANGLGLGVKTARGVLDVAGVERDRKIGLPTKAIDVISGRGNLEALGLLQALSAIGNVTAGVTSMYLGHLEATKAIASRRSTGGRSTHSISR